MKEKQGCVYLLRNLVNGKGYVGQHCSLNPEKRWARHIADIEKCDTPLYRALRKYGVNKFSAEVLWQGSAEHLNTKEMYYIKKLKTFINNDGYNLTHGGGGMLGFRLSAATRRILSQQKIGSTLTFETREKVSVSLKKFFNNNPDHLLYLSSIRKGRKMSQASRHAISLANKGREVSTEHRRKLSIAQTGKKFSLEAREKMSMSHIGKPWSAVRRAAFEAKGTP